MFSNIFWSPFVSVREANFFLCKNIKLWDLWYEKRRRRKKKHYLLKGKITVNFFLYRISKNSCTNNSILALIHHQPVPIGVCVVIYAHLYKWTLSYTIFFCSLALFFIFLFLFVYFFFCSLAQLMVLLAVKLKQAVDAYKICLIFKTITKRQ